MYSGVVVELGSKTIVWTVWTHVFVSMIAFTVLMSNVTMYHHGFQVRITWAFIVVETKSCMDCALEWNSTFSW